MEIRWEVLNGWSVKEPSEEPEWNALKIYMPYGLPECVLMPGDDTMIPTGLWFPGLNTDYLIIPVHHTYPNKESDVMGKWREKLREDIPIIHMSILNDSQQVFLHLINLGKTELIYKPGQTIAYFCFTELINLKENNCWNV